jgi:hypothetical protein
MIYAEIVCMYALSRLQKGMNYELRRNGVHVRFVMIAYMLD